MSERTTLLRRNRVVALGAAAGIYLLAGCSGDVQAKSSEPHAAAQSSLPPLVKPGQHISCHQVVGRHPGKVQDIPLDDAAIGELGQIFQQSSSTIEKDAAVYIADCDASLTSSRAERDGYFVDLAEAPKPNKCVTYTALFPNGEAVKANSPTNRFLLICANYLRQSTQGPATQV